MTILLLIILLIITAFFINNVINKHKDLKDCIITKGIDQAIKELPSKENFHVNEYLNRVRELACKYIIVDYKKYSIRDYKNTPSSDNEYMYGNDLNEIDNYIQKITNLKYIEMDD